MLTKGTYSGRTSPEEFLQKQAESTKITSVQKLQF